MTCRSVRSLLSTYADGELRGTDMVAVRRHLGSCAACQAELDSVLALKRTLSVLPDRYPNEEFESRLRERVFTAQPNLSVGVARTRWTLALAATAAVLCAVATHWAINGSSESVVDRDPGFDIASDQALVAGADPMVGRAPIITVSDDGW